MLNGRAKLAVGGISAANLFLVGFSAIFGVHGDGSPGGAPLIFCVGGLWVLAFAARGFFLIHKGDHDAAIELTLRALPYAALTLMLGVVGIMLLHFAAATFGVSF